MAKYYILIDIDQKGNWYAGVPYQDKLNAFNSGARYPGNAVTPYAQFIVINLPDTVAGISDYTTVPEVDATSAVATPVNVVQKV